MATTTSRTLTGSTLVVGTDIGKTTNYSCLMALEAGSTKSFSYSNTLDGFKSLVKRIESFQKEHRITDVIVALESTNNYWYPLAYYIKFNTPYRLVQVNCKHTKRFKDVTDNTSNKTDYKDPKVIAQIVMIGSGLKVNLPLGDKASLRELTRGRKTLLEDKKRAYNRLHALLAKFFPEILNTFKNISCKTCIYLMENYPGPGQIARQGHEKLAKELKRVSRGRFTDFKSKILYEASQKSIGVQEGWDGHCSIFSFYLEQLKMLQTQIGLAEQKIVQALQSVPEYTLLKSIKGLGDITIATIISETGNFNDFPTSKGITKYAGINLVENSSGKHQGQRRISKIGNQNLRTALYFGVLRMIKKDGIYHQLYQHHLSKGMKKKKAIMAIVRKLLRTIHAMIKNNNKFEDNHGLNVVRYNSAA